MLAAYPRGKFYREYILKLREISEQVCNWLTDVKIPVFQRSSDDKEFTRRVVLVISITLPSAFKLLWLNFQ